VAIGKVVVIEPDGTFLVDYPQNSLGPLQARTIIEHLRVGDEVLLGFAGGDPTLPIVLGHVYDHVRARPRTLHLKADKILLEAQEQLLLQCGQGTLETLRDGKVRLRGKDILSRASRTNKIQGASVRIN
jgi:hypothetical protein